MAQVTDPVLLKELARQGIDPADVDFDQDYAPHSQGKRHSPNAKFYTTKSGFAKGKQFSVISGLPMVDADGVKCDPQWIATGNVYRQKANVYDALVNDIPGRITLTVKNDDAVGRKKNDRVVFSPQLYLNGVEVPRPASTLLPVDPLNPNYVNNTIEWDYGICKRRIRAIEGHILGSWVFAQKPTGEVRIKYNQTGDYKLKLGQFKINEDEELIPKAVFDDPETVYPFIVSDSATFYPDTNAAGVDGAVGRRYDPTQTWANLRANAGTHADSSLTIFQPGAEMNQGIISFAGYAPDPYDWYRIQRGIIVLDTSGLPDDATISAATLSLYGTSKLDQQGSWQPNINIYASTPASNTALAAADYGQIGTTAFSDTPITYANWLVADPFWNSFAFNAAGIAAIKKLAGEVTKLGVRNASYDVSGTPPAAPTGTSEKYTWLTAYTSEQGNGYKPKLVVTYTTGAAAYDVDAAVAVGVLPAATRIWDGVSFTSAVLIGELVAATRTATFARVSSIVSGMLVAATRIWDGITISSSVLIGELVSVTRIVAFTRTAPVLSGMLVSASVAWGRTINAAVSIGELVTASRVATFGRVSSVLTGTLVSATRIWDGAIFTASVLIGEAVSATRAIAFSRVAAVSDGLLVSATRLVTYTRVSPILTGLLVSATRVINYPRLASVQVGELVAATRAFAATRVSSVISGILVIATRLTTYTRASAVISGLVVTGLRVYGRTRTASVSIGLLVIGRFWTRMKRRLAQVGTNRDLEPW